MYELKKMERYLRVNLLGPEPRLMKNNLPVRRLTEVEKHWFRLPGYYIHMRLHATAVRMKDTCTS